MGSNQQPFRPGMTQGPPQAGQMGQGMLLKHPLLYILELESISDHFMRIIVLDH
jgi:hypothetical protein